MSDKLLTTKEAAQYLGMSKAFLERDRCEDQRIPFVRVGSRAVRYRLADLNAFIHGQTQGIASREGVQHAGR